MNAAKQAKSETRNWMLLSSQESIAREIPSITAIIETILSIPIYFAVLVQFGTYIPLLLSIVVAPLVLMRSDESVALGLRWFKKWLQFAWLDHTKAADLPPNEYRMLGRILGWGPWIGFVGTLAVALILLPNLKTWSALWSITVLGFVAALNAAVVGTLFVVTGWRAAFAHAASARSFHGATLAILLVSVLAGNWLTVLGVAIISTIAWSILFFGSKFPRLDSHVQGFYFSLSIVPGVLLLTLAIRVMATLFHIVPGVRNIPRNFRRLALCTSPLQEPELMPGYRGDESPFSFQFMREIFLERSRSIGIVNAALNYTIPTLVWFIPGWTYRFVPKSTSWFWWPLAFLGGEVKRAKNPKEFRRKIIGSLWARATIVVASSAIVIFLATNLLVSGAIFRENPLLTVFGYFLIIDKGLFPWQLLTILVSVLSLAVVFWLDDACGELENATGANDAAALVKAERKLGWIERLGRLRFLLTIGLWPLVGSQAVLYFNAQSCWFEVPQLISQWAAWAYGPKLPQSHCI